MAKNEFAALRSFITEEVAGTFYDEVGDRRKAFEQRITQETKELFRETASIMGTDDVPELIAPYVPGGYEDISESWRRRKFRRKGLKKHSRDKRKTPGGFNRFHVGIGHGPRLKTLLARRDVHRAFGKPRVRFLNPTATTGSFRAEQGGRVFRNLKTGRFASPKNVRFEATLEIDLFPKLTNERRMLNLMTGKGRMKLALIEFDSAQRKARPLLAPMLEYYRNEKIDEIISRMIRR